MNKKDEIVEEEVSALKKGEEINVEEVKAPDAAPAEDETVNMKATELAALMKRVTDLEGAVSSQKLSESQASNAPKALPSAFLKIFQEKIVVGWKAEKAELIYHPSNSNVPVGETLKATYFFVDGTNSGVTDQVLFTRAEDRVNVSIVEDMGTSVKIRFDSIVSSDSTLTERLSLPKEMEPYEIRKDFLNP